MNHVLVAIALRPTLERGEVATDVGLRIARAPMRVSVEDRLEVLGFLVLRAVGDDRGADPGQAHEVGTQRGRAAGRHLLLQYELSDQIAAAAAPFPRPVEADPAFRPHLPIPFAHKGRILVGRGIGKVRVEERTDLFAEGLLFGREVEIHQIVPPAPIHFGSMDSEPIESRARRSR